MDKIQTNLYVGYTGPVLCTLGLLSGTDLLLAFIVNNLMFFAYLCIIPFIRAYEKNKNHKVHTTLLLILYLIYNFTYNIKMGILSLIIFIFWLKNCNTKDISDIDLYASSPLKLAFSLYNIKQLMFYFLLYLACNSWIYW